MTRHLKIPAKFISPGPFLPKCASIKPTIASKMLETSFFVTPVVLAICSIVCDLVRGFLMDKAIFFNCGAFIAFTVFVTFLGAFALGFKAAFFAGIALEEVIFFLDIFVYLQ